MTERYTGYVELDIKGSDETENIDRASLLVVFILQHNNVWL